MVARIRNPPDASALMASARSFGSYDLPAALADLIDNSISALAKSIEIHCIYGSGDPIVRVRDDGNGMSKLELEIAMRPACANPMNSRHAEDLGRFGWGMKSASFSQCKKLIVVSKKDGNYSAASWNLEEIDEWMMSSYSGIEAERLLESSICDRSGTEVIWMQCDRLGEEGAITADQFNAVVNQARRKLSLLFHRFLTGSPGVRKISISVNGTPLNAVDPFHSKHPATQAFPAESFYVLDNAKATVKAYTLPHYSKLEASEYESLGGEEGYVRNQGFYVYRNNRLIIYGTWFRLARHGELSKLIRISIDIPNTLDYMWKVTIDKSDVQLPSVLRQRMKALIDKFRTSSARVFKGKGGKISPSSNVAIWDRFVKNQQVSYKLNRAHPIINKLIQSLKNERRDMLLTAIKLIETELPIDSLFADSSANPHQLNQSSTDRDELLSIIQQAYFMLRDTDNTRDEVVAKMRMAEPFCSHWLVVEHFLNNIAEL